MKTQIIGINHKVGHVVIAASLALLVCCLTAASRVLLKKGLDGAGVHAGMYLSLLIGCVALDALALIVVPFDLYNIRGVLFFAVIGVVAPPIVRGLTYVGIARSGPAATDSIRSLTPLFSIVFAALIFKESVGVGLLIGAGLIVCGSLIVFYRPMASSAAPSWLERRNLLFPLTAAIIAGAVANFRKNGLEVLHSALLAAAVAATSALVTYTVYLHLTGQLFKVRASGKAKYFLVAASGLTAATDVLDLTALKMGSVASVSPILATSPIFTLFFSHLFLKGVAPISKELIIGTIVSFIGVQCILYSVS